MNSARQELIDMVADPDTYAKPYGQLLPLQIEAVNQHLAQQRERISLLDRRARDAGLTAVSSLHEMAPLLFPHTSYKSYPMAFLQQGRWDKMFQWLKTVAAVKTEQVDLDGVSNFDQWIARMWESGNRITITSGTSGKPSILNANQEDQERIRYCSRNTPDIDKALTDGRRWHYFQVTPRSGPYAMMIFSQAHADARARPDSLHYLSDEPLTVLQVLRAIDMRNRIANSTATPQEIADFEVESTARQGEMALSLKRMAQKMADVRHEPIWLTGVWPQVWLLVEELRKLGVKPGEFHPDSVIAAGGGRKGTNIPEDFEEQITQFLCKDIRRTSAYSMSEMSGPFRGCEAGRYHQLPSIVTCLMDDAGEQILEQRGLVTGRFAFMDLAFDGRWGGLITGDKVTIDFSESCPCGRPGLTVLPNIVRYQDIGDDKIGCAGTIDAYISGTIAS